LGVCKNMARYQEKSDIPFTDKGGVD
jgi:hypothetical protein